MSSSPTWKSPCSSAPSRSCRRRATCAASSPTSPTPRRSRPSPRTSSTGRGVPPPLQQRRRHLRRGRPPVGAGAERLDVVLLGQRLRGGQRDALVRTAHDRLGRARSRGQHLERRRRHRPGALRLGLRLEQGRHLLPHRGTCTPAGRRRHPAGSGSVLPVGRPARNRPVDGAAQPARGAGQGQTPSARPGHDVRGVQGAARGVGASGRDHGPPRLGRFCVAGIKRGTSSSATTSREAPTCCADAPTPSRRPLPPAALS